MRQIPLRKAFSMLTAIVVIVLMSTVAMMVMNLSGKMVKETTSQFQREQAMLLAKSYTEYAIMAVMSNDRNGTGNCLRDIDGQIKIDNSSSATVAKGNGYRVRVRISYIGSAAEVSSCASTRILSSSVSTFKTPLNIVVDTYVDHKDPQNTTGPWITYHKRTLQKI
jgi:type II secretory pathway pseudopilin PulG